MMSTKIASQIAGISDCNEQSDHDITPEERNFAIEIAHELATRNGIDLDALVAKQHASEAKYAHEHGFTA